MRKVIGFFIVCAALAAADPTVTTTGIGARAYGMAGNFTALANDFSALFWNPAGLAFVQVREVHCAIDLDRQNAETGFGVGASHSTEALNQRVRLSSIGLLRSVPTTRGGFSLALGFSRPWLLDDLNNFSGVDVYKGKEKRVGDYDSLTTGDTLFRDKDDHNAQGQCGLWNAGMGWQIAPGLGFGFTVGLLVGSEQREIGSVSHTRRSVFENVAVSIDREYFGYDLRCGLLYKPSERFSVGCRLDLPRRAKVGENYRAHYPLSGTDEEQTSLGTLQSSFSGAIGAAAQLPFLTIASDLSFRSPLRDAPPQSDQDFWKEGIGVGVEVPLRFLAGLFRCGYTYSQFDLSPMQIKWDDGGVDTPEPFTVLRNHHLVTAGYSQFVGSNVSFEIAYGFSFWKFSSSDPSWQATITECHVAQRGTLSLAIRY